MSKLSSPSFLFIPGGFCPGFFYHKVVEKLVSLGYEAIALDLPSVGQEPGKPTASGYDDAAFVRAKAVEWMDAGKDVIFVANSYGGFVAQEAAQGLSREDRDAAGHKNAGALVRIVLLSSFLWTLGATVQDMVGAHIPVDTATKSADIEYINPIPAEMAGPFLCGSLANEEQLYYGAMCKAHAAKSFVDPLTYAAYEFIPTMVVIGTDDKALSPELQHKNVDEVIARQSEKGAVLVRKVAIEADHCSMLSHPQKVVQLCLEAAKAE